MPRTDELIFPRWLLPVRPGGVVLENHALAVADGRIAAIIPAADACAQWPDAHQVHLPDHVLMPGLVNAHTHAAMTLFRGFADDLRLQTWLQEHIWPAESKYVSEEFVRDGSALAVLEMLRGGITCFNDMYFCPDATAAVASAAGMRAVLGMVIIDVPTAFGSGADDYFEQGLAFHGRWNQHPLIRISVAPHSAFSLNDQQLLRVSNLAAELDVPIHMHVHETQWEVNESIAEFGMRPLQRLANLNFLSPRLLAVHMTQLLEQEIQAVAEAGVQVLHCPESNLKLASGFCPVARLQQAGINVCVGTDGAASNNDLDLIAEMRTAALLGKCVAGDPEQINAVRALEMITINSARALGLEAEIGSLEVGKQADLCAVDLSYPETQPVHHVISQLVYAAGRNQVSDVWVAGRRVLEARETPTLDEVDILARAHGWQQKMQSGSPEAVLLRP